MVWVIFPLSGNAQVSYLFDHIDTRDLANQEVTSIIQDRTGFIWVGTGQGLYRYDGYQFRLFLIAPENQSNLTNNSIMSLFEDHRGRIWVGTVEGLFMFDPATEGFTSFRALADAAKINRPVVDIEEDENHNIWMITNTLGNVPGGLVIYDSVQNTFQQYNHHGVLNFPTSMVRDESGKLWIGSNQGLIIFDPVERKIIEHVMPVGGSTNSLCSGDLSFIYREKNGVMLVASYQNGFSRITYDGAGKMDFSNYNVSDGLSSNCILSMMRDRKGNCWIVTPKGVNVFSMSNRTAQVFRPSDRDRVVTQETMSRVVLEDRSGNIWIGHQGEGISRVKPNKGFMFLTSSQSGNILRGEIVSAVFSDSTDNLWVAISGKGIRKIDFNSDFNTLPSVEFFDLPDRYVNTIDQDADGNILLAVEREGFFLLDVSSGKITKKSNHGYRMVRQLSDETLLLSDVWRLYIGKQRASAYDISSLVTDSATFKRIVWPEYSSLAHEGGDKYWLATWQGDLFFYDRSRNQFLSPKIDRAEPLRISQLHVDRQKFLWLTAFEGLFKYRIIQNDAGIALKLEKKYTEKDGLITKEGASNLFTPSMAEDNKGNIWLGHLGLTMIDTKSNKSTTYYVDEGLPFAGFSMHSAVRMKSGHLVFGTKNGLLIFHPDSLRQNQHAPPVVITDFTVLNKRTLLAKDVKLKYYENVLTFDFTALDFTTPDKNRYAYQMVGFDPHWVDAGTRRTATYTNLDPGTYTFHVKASNSDGVWNERGASFTIVILPPPWKTWWAYAIYSAAFIVLLLLARREIIKRERLQHEFKLKELEASKYHEIDAMKSRFFANISHEFRTPLTLILAPIQKRLELAQSTEDKIEFSLIQRNASRLLKLVNQLLDLSRLEAGTMGIKASNGDLVSFTRLLVQGFQSMAESRNISFIFHSDVQIINMWFDHEKLEKIIVNLLSNAFKFTPPGGAVSVKVFAETNPSKDFKDGYAGITVSDSGVGIPEEQLVKIFDRFYQVDSSQTREYEGSGIGLALTKELIELHSGQISVNSTPGAGTIFTVKLPLGNSHLRHEDVVGSIPKTNVLPVIDAFEYPLVDNNPSPALQQDTILIVEDNDDLRYYIKENLSELYTVLDAKHGKEGIDIAREKIPDLVLSDLMMPQMDGTQMCSVIKNDIHTSHIPVILLTAKADGDSRIHGLDSGADDYIPKPFEMRELRARIRNLIENRKKLRARFSGPMQFNPAEVEVSSMDEKFLAKIKQIVETNLSNPAFGVEPFALEAGMSAAQLYRKLTGLTGYSPNDFIRHMRLQRAADLLSKKAGNVADVAYQVGFSNLSYFSKCFREKFEVTPSEYLKNGR